MSLAELRDAIVTGLAADSRLTGVRILAHHGQFDAGDLARFGENAPFVAVSLLRVGDVQWQGDNIASVCTFTAVCIAKTVPGPARAADNPAIPQYRRDRNAINLADAVMRSLAVSQWPDLPGVSRAYDIAAKNAFTDSIDRQDIAMWVIAWKQNVDLLDEPTDLDDLASVHVDYDVFPRDNAADLGDAIEAQDDIELETDP